MDNEQRTAWRHWLHVQLEPAHEEHDGLTAINIGLILLIILSVSTTVLETELTLGGQYSRLFYWLETGFAILFAIEYLARAWASGVDPRYGPGWRGKLRFMLSPLAIIDLLALLSVLLMWAGSEPFCCGCCACSGASPGQVGPAFGGLVVVDDAIHSRRFELTISLVFAMFLLLVTSTLLYLVEAGIQPENFGSIPRAMWWSIATLTTVGYGDVYPLTAFGRILAGGTAIIGIGLIAMPTGILAAAFSDALQQQRDLRAIRQQAEMKHRLRARPPR
ncbi:MAG: potassium channel family protein [Burkholderiaceae bacterium]